jgi:hypothetical protein
MKLTEDENQILYRIKKQEAAWCSWGKWMVLLFGVFYLILFIRTLFLLSAFHPPRPELAAHAILSLSIGVVAIVYATQNWAGTVHSLYIKLIDAAVQNKE